MSKKPTRPPLTEADLVVGRTYRAKNFRQGPFGHTNDRTILWIGIAEVQYDSDTVRTGFRYPKVTKEKFLKWASHVVPATSEEKTA